MRPGLKRELNDRAIAKLPIAIRIKEMKDSTSPSDNAAKNTAARQAKEKRSVLIMEPERVERALGGGTDYMPIDELSFCKTLLEEKQAQMDILSEKEMGTTITPTLPI